MTAPTTRPRGHLVSAAVMLGISPLAALWMGLATMAAGNCPSNARPICTPGGQFVVVGMPVLALAAGILIAVAGGHVAVRRGHRPTLWIVVSWSVLVVASVVAVSVGNATR
ncbi:hypothetical protein F0L68_19910 [Solihabitans fulvus]|uniref:Transmembrane protein n=1 Tax=Solihabitans fulvus TaxID=1892852 RepID=A0A5B2XBV6_9PSEU|nr:hypothetical protein [Solihabitans fulvus]KAA2260665.1 hypothetical protein F0L68_19910 [Solihabitans fulvus]